MLEFNVPGGKLNRGMAVLDVVKAIKDTEVLPALIGRLLATLSPTVSCSKPQKKMLSTHVRWDGA